MAKQQIVKCRYCGEEVVKDEAYSPQKGQYYCSENHYLSALEKKKQSTKHSYKSQEGTDRRDYTDYIQDIYVNDYGWDKNKINWQILMAQTNNLLKANPEWNYETIKYVIWYEKEILDIDLICKDSNWSPLTLVDFHYQEAKNYFFEMQELEEAMNNFDFNTEIKVIKKQKNNKKYYKKVLFDD